jgi:hypothetical protein
MTDWGTDYNNLPSGSSNPFGWAGAIRSTRSNTSARFLHEHTWSGSIPVDGYHREGSFKAYYTDTEPVYRPDGETELNANDEGRIWYNPTTKCLFGYTGTGFSSIRFWETHTLDETSPTDNTVFDALSPYIPVGNYLKLCGGATDSACAGNGVLFYLISYAYRSDTSNIILYLQGHYNCYGGGNKGISNGSHTVTNGSSDVYFGKLLLAWIRGK